MSVILMRIHKYIPERLYGFTVDSEGLQVFFHLGAFQPGLPAKSPLIGGHESKHPSCQSCTRESCLWAESPPPPVLGEPVQVEVEIDPVDTGKAPRATKVLRIQTPLALRGLVETFDATRGYGFIKGDDGTSYHLHQSELLDGRIPRTGQSVMFYAGIRLDKPRACHIKVCL